MKTKTIILKPYDICAKINKEKFTKGKCHCSHTIESLPKKYFGRSIKVINKIDNLYELQYYRTFNEDKSWNAIDIDWIDHGEPNYLF